ncbi:calcium-dependent cysteine-type endopeptidase [Aureococcus anophagefferens]|nr:calcium-dependent cysteine-type endopeptidase [Aureococcus anophagefferens]
MGVRSSTLTGRSVVDERLRRFTAWDDKRVEKMQLAHVHDLGGRLALGPKHFVVLLKLDEEEALPIFHEVFDTDKNGLVDAFEVMSAVIVLSSMPIKRKVDTLHGLFDFNLSGELTIDELTIFFRTVAAGCGKMDDTVKPPRIAQLEEVTRWAFTKAARSTDSDLTKTEFDRFVFTDPAIRHFLEYFDQASSQVLIADGCKWEDPTVFFYDDDAKPPVGLPSPGVSLQLMRPEDFMIATPKLFKDEAEVGKLVQGGLSDVWFLSAVAVLLTNPKKLRKLFVQTGQEDPEGRFALQFYRDGCATVVYVDDRVPVDPNRRPCFARTDDPCELWLLLLQKAFAKHHGVYETLKAGSTRSASRLTGGASAVVVEDCAYEPNDELGFWLELDEFAATFHEAFSVKTYDPAVWNTQRRGAQFPAAPEGGCFNMNSWVANPQFFLELPNAADLVITLSQGDLDGDLESLGLAVVEYDYGDDKGDVKKVATILTDAVRGVTKDFLKRKEITMALKLPEGRYCIIPMTFKPPRKGGACYVTTKCTSPHVLLNENEILAQEQPTTGVSEHDQILLDADPGPRVDPQPDIETLAVRQLDHLVGKMWAQAHGLLHEKRKLKDRLSTLMKDAEEAKQEKAKEAEEKA